MTHEPITIIGQNTYRGTSKTFGIQQTDRLAHMWVLGKTGTGKSTLLKNLIFGDIQAGRGCMLIDPHGDLVEEILGLIPEHRIKDAIYFDPTDTEYPIGYNPLDASLAPSSVLLAEGLLSVLKKSWPDFWGPRMEYLLRSSLLSLLYLPNATLLDLHRLLVDPDFRAKLLALVSDPQLVQFWTKEFAGYSPGFRTEGVAPILNKIGQYLMNPILRNILGQRKSAFSLRRLIDEGGIFLANLSRGQLGEDTSRLLGSLLVTQVELAALSRANVPPASRRNFFLYIDEAHVVATRTMVDLFPEARKYRLGIILAHQYLDQLEEPLRFAVMGNVGSMITFRLGSRDATVIAREYAPIFEDSHILNLPAYQAYLKLMINGIASRPFSCTTFPPPDVNYASRETVVTHTRERYARPRTDVEASLRGTLMSTSSQEHTTH